MRLVLRDECNWQETSSVNKLSIETQYDFP